MNDGIEYAKMIEIPQSDSVCVYKRKKSILKKKKVIDKINRDIDRSDCFEPDCDCSEKESVKALVPVSDKQGGREKFKSAVIKAQVAVAFALVLAIILTNVFWENSGMNTLFKSVFGAQSQDEADERVYSDFSLNLPVKGEGVSLVEGVISVVGEYALYPVCEGKISKISRAEDGTYTVTVKHSDSFSSVTEGASAVYFSEGDEVNRHVPLGFTQDKAFVYLYDDGALITDYAAVENSIIFNK